MAVVKTTLQDHLYHCEYFERYACETPSLLIGELHGVQLPNWVTAGCLMPLRRAVVLSAEAFMLERRFEVLDLKLGHCTS